MPMSVSITVNFFWAANKIPDRNCWLTNAIHANQTIKYFSINNESFIWHKKCCTGGHEFSVLLVHSVLQYQLRPQTKIDKIVHTHTPIHHTSYIVCQRSVAFALPGKLSIVRHMAIKRGALHLNYTPPKEFAFVFDR